MPATTTSQHTPGPLQYAFEGGTVAFIVESDGTTVAKLSVTENTTAHSRLEANVRLLSAAPDLLEALRLMVDLVELAVPFEGDTLRRARAAIARAVAPDDRDAAITSYYEDRAKSGLSALEARP